MKKLVGGFFCVSASAVFAAVTNVVATVDVIEVDSGLKNTIVAIPGLDLAGGLGVLATHGHLTPAAGVGSLGTGLEDPDGPKILVQSGRVCHNYLSR